MSSASIDMDVEPFASVTIVDDISPVTIEQLALGIELPIASLRTTETSRFSSGDRRTGSTSMVSTVGIRETVIVTGSDVRFPTSVMFA